MRYFLSILLLAVVVAAGYFAVAHYVTVANGQSDLVAEQSQVSADGAQVLALLNRLKAITLNGKIFTNPNFLTLEDWSVEIAPQTVGRPNPYLPAAGSASNSGSNTGVPLPRSTR